MHSRTISHPKIPPRYFARRSCLRKAKPFVGYRDSLLAIEANRRVPPTMQTIELKQMSCRFDAALDLIDVNDVETVAGSWIAARPKNAAECGTQGQPSNTAHAIYSNSHRSFLSGRNLGRIANFIQPRLKGHSVQRRKRKAGEDLDTPTDHRVQFIQQGRAFSRRAFELCRIGEGPGGTDVLASEIWTELPVRHVAQRDDEVHSRRIGPLNSFQDLHRSSFVSWPRAFSRSMTSGSGLWAGSAPAEYARKRPRPSFSSRASAMIERAEF